MKALPVFFRKLFSLLTPHDKRFLWLLLVFSIVVSLMETAGVAVIMPFISVASNFDLIETNRAYAFLYEAFGFRSQISFVVLFGVALVGFYLFRSAVNFFYFYQLARFSKGRYHLLAYRLLENYLGRSYHDFVQTDSSDIKKTILSEATYLTNILSALLLILSELFVILFIYLALLYISWNITLILTFFLLLNALFLVRTVSKKIKIEGGNRERYQKKFFDILIATIGNFKMLKLKSNDERILEKFKTASIGYANANISNEALGHFPRLFMEALGFIVVIFIVLYLLYSHQEDMASVMPVVAMFVLGLYRLLPSANRILNAYNQILFNYKSLDIIHNDLIYEIEDLGDEVMKFETAIELRAVSFAYIEERPILEHVTLRIGKGEKVAFVGESGSGKSTLIDLIIGLYRPKEGTIAIDDRVLNSANIRSWRQKIGYIPQSIYLFDGTVAQNVALGESVDRERIEAVLEQAKILDFLREHHQGIDTRVGENGLKLSGGQKQRVAIARALYNDPEILVLDEATAALDEETEGRIMDEIYELGRTKTLLIIAHRLSTIERCGTIYRVERGAAVKSSFPDICRKAKGDEDDA